MSRRPNLATEEAIGRWYKALSGGSTQREAADYAGLKLRTTENWLGRGRKFNQADEPVEDDAWYGEFFNQTVQKRTTPLVRAAATLVEALTEAPWPQRISAAQFLLEKRSPEWARNAQFEIEAMAEATQRDNALEAAEALLAEID